MKRIDALLNAATSRFRYDAGLRQEIARELRGHLEDSIAAACAEGMDEAQAEAAAVRAFGDPEEVAEKLWRANRRRLRRRVWALAAVGGLLVPACALYGLSRAPSLIVLVFLMVLVFVPLCRFLSSCLSCLPEQHRKLDPGRVWLLLIPIFNIVWLFFVLTKIAKSFQDYFAAQGRRDFGDCGYKLAVVQCICDFIPGVNIAGIILFAKLLQRFSALKMEVERSK